MDGPWGLGEPNTVARMAATAAYWGLSGPDTVQGLDTGAALDAKAKASVDPRLIPIVTDYLTSWHSYGAFMGPQVCSIMRCVMRRSLLLTHGALFCVTLYGS